MSEEQIDALLEKLHANYCLGQDTKELIQFETMKRIFEALIQQSDRKSALTALDLQLQKIKTES